MARKPKDMRIEDALVYVLGQVVQAEDRLKKRSKDAPGKLEVGGLGATTNRVVSALHQLPESARDRLLEIKIPAPLPVTAAPRCLLRNAAGIGARIIFELEWGAKGKPVTEAWNRLRGSTSDYNDSIRNVFFVALDEP